ncbi:SusC/RagA family TonB-linked outer membrane protein [Cellulophaga tyrosinoxydans]|uniref:TonB-linked outer membrane protein, SusC/RagA family n=1 Tax=Cellulophaga tyrosinoxydans TaxID=504486 RepID=A0A1W2API3_9FLAO|nr:TonB-dependent receptor [Cellulophaga tyrosinoxydans]SMC62118.1 TonB-linked outer membrane protein, SusC/RagA family [Cellulophaga tyrosinoxydans]
MKHIILLLSTIFFTTISWSQEFTINGNVKDSNINDVLPGVNVVVKNQTRGTTSDFDGNFTLDKIKVGDVLVFSYIGYTTKEIAIKNANFLNLTLDEDVSALSEVVVVGYGTQTKKEITGAVSVIGAETIEDLNPTRIEQALQGQVAGVQITSESGSPGSGSSIRIRGISTNGDARPLILVDGNVIEDLSVVNPGDIESINVLKDATAGIYGVRAANGVILITTKSGKRNTDLKFSYDMYAGFQETSRKIPVLNATEYAIIINEAYAAGGQTAPYPNVANLGTGTDWQDEVFQKAPVINHNLTISGGTDKSSYAFSTSLLTQDGIVGGNKANFKRFTSRINFDTDVFKNLKLTTNLIYTGTNKKGLNEGGLGSVLFNSINNSPTLAVKDANGNYTLSEGLGNEVVNPLAQIENTFNSTVVDKLSGVLGLKYSFLNDFTFQTNYQFNYAEVQGRYFSPLAFYGSGKVFNNEDRPSLSVNKDIFRDYTWDTFINYDKTFNENHNFSATLGMSVFKTTGLFSGSTQGFFTEEIDFASAEIENTVDQRNGLKLSGAADRFDERLLSYFTRLQYNYKGKYLLSGVLRRDGSTKFGPNNRFGYFPSGSLGWVVSDENFLVDSKTINFLKLRASYGILGNDRIASNAFRGLLNGEAAYVLNNQLVFGRSVGILPNPEIQWEQQETLDIGIDLKLFDNKIDITADYFKKTTNELLLQPPASGILGVSAPGSSSPVVNGGTVENTGFEFAIGYKKYFSDDFNIGINYNITFLENKAIAVNNGLGFIAGGGFGVGQDLPSRFEEGKPLGYFFGLQTDGIFQNQDEIEDHAIQANAAPGDLRFVDTNEDGVIDADDRVDIGNPIPDATMGLNLTFNYKNWDFNSYAFASVGNDIVRNYERVQPLVNKSVYTLNRWTGEGTSNKVPRVTTGATGNNQFSDYFVEDGSFIRIQNIQLGYSLPMKVVDRFGMSKLRFYLSANNLLTLTKYRGYDPSASSGSPIGAGIDYGFYPVPRTYLLGINLKF